ncbi:unnamed protein product [Fraxinus pennsylvanica]|uniref:Uncharacterized protein n=1 Tax=Fraxinus pennsylvanica TaxID=56036 RepID=A0AAD1Z6G5_9LAMI|nr:unnamed protein product [Fraxinus pennsylvanica]
MCLDAAFDSTAPACTSVASVMRGSFTILPETPLTKFSMEESASLACYCFIIVSLWHLEHIFMVAAVPKKPVVEANNGRSGAWQPVSFEDSIIAKIMSFARIQNRKYM